MGRESGEAERELLASAAALMAVLPCRISECGGASPPTSTAGRIVPAAKQVGALEISKPGIRRPDRVTTSRDQISPHDAGLEGRGRR